jgi:ABC-type oligopeptide transport system substrate-binding subunit
MAGSAIMKYANKYVCIVVTVAVLALSGCKDKGASEKQGEMVLHHSLNSKIKCLDPIMIQDEYSLNVCSQILETLYQYHYLKRPYRLVPLLADGMPEISDDKLTCTVRIKKGVYFQDDKCFPNSKGRELKASDFVYCIKRMADIKNLSPNYRK